MGQIETGAEAHPKLAAGRESLPYPVDDLGDYGSTYLLGAMIGIRSLLSGYTSDCSTPSWPTIKRMRSFIALSTLSFLLKVSFHRKSLSMRVSLFANINIISVKISLETHWCIQFILYMCVTGMCAGRRTLHSGGEAEWIH